MHQPFIPVIHSIPDGAALIDTVLSEYPINKPLSCKLYKRGLNDTYLVETKSQKYILRVYRRGWRNKEEIDFELELLTFLHKSKQPIAYPIARKDGDLTTEITAPEGTRYVAVFSYAPGCAVNEKLNVRQSYLLGEALAKIHISLDSFQSSFSRPALNSEYLLDWSVKAIKLLYNHRKSDINYLQKEVEKIKIKLKEFSLPLSAPAYGICVSDVHSGNAHFNEDNEPTLFDFDQCGYGWRAFDIGKFMHFAMRMKIDVEVRNSFIEGYQDIRKLSKVELASIPVFVKVAHIWVMGISANAVEDVLSYGWFDDDWLDARLGLFRNLD
ncbi:phosphotransferase [Fischerella sp. PCC 9605]|uniref:phosphotransferase n=1 Tax=Fischerella sp. PCC 9605 TaxID=1173024 RepID=UPI00047EC589|nr:phosphotransferase [Fischerella sp. PCC 9605]